MARKDNKTEQVLRLITRTTDKDMAIRAEQAAQESEAALAAVENEVMTEEPKIEEPIVEETVPPAPEPEPEPEPEIKLEDIPVPPKEPIPATMPINVAPKPTHERELAGDHIGLHNAPPPVRRSDDLDIINLSELLAYEMMGEVMHKLNVCSCRLCQADVLALTLNYLPQKYVTTDAGKQYMQLDLYRKQYETDILSALTRACVRVKGSPRHS